jgi:hypothetical protein
MEPLPCADGALLIIDLSFLSHLRPYGFLRHGGFFIAAFTFFIVEAGVLLV